MSTMTIMASGRPADPMLAWSRILVDPARRAVVDRLPASLGRICGYHVGWWDEHGHLIPGDAGKVNPPALVLLAAQGVGGSAEMAVSAAVAVELVHNFSLRHDDVMDGDLIRRHRPTVWSVFGVSEAILAGDALFALGSWVLACDPSVVGLVALEWLGETTIVLCDGQWADVAFERRVDVGVQECLVMAAGKIGALLGCACALGALFGGAEVSPRPGAVGLRSRYRRGPASDSGPPRPAHVIRRAPETPGHRPRVGGIPMPWNRSFTARGPGGCSPTDTSVGGRSSPRPRHPPSMLRYMGRQWQDQTDQRDTQVNGGRPTVVATRGAHDKKSDAAHHE
ncbi:MAG: polyprenyl synthetase family protein [Pseudonocardiaceae bacterium]